MTLVSRTLNPVTNVVVVTSVRLLGDSLVASLREEPTIGRIFLVDSYPGIRRELAVAEFHLALIDVLQGVDAENVRSLALEWPSVRLIAIGLAEQRDEVIRCGRAGFSGYVPRDASLETFRQMILDCCRGRLCCSAEIACDLFRALFSGEPLPDEAANDSLTSREDEVMQLVGQGLSNKEIARELDLSVATVKHHVHNILEKLDVPTRTHVARHIRDPARIRVDRTRGRS